MPDALPAWLDRRAYPFASRTLDTPHGALRYLDEGEGPPVVLVHGTPTWSFLFRHLVAGLRARHRVVAVDHLGFGLSDKPADAPYAPADHARRLAALVEHLGLRDLSLVVHDFGGPIGLSYAVERPANVRRLVLFNTWMWSLADVPAVARASRIAAGPIGRFLYRTLNVSPRVLMKAVVADRRSLPPAVHRQYVAPFGSRAERTAPWVLARELAGSTAWYDALWQRRDRLRDVPTLLVWGLKDPTFGPDALARWQAALPHAEVERLPDVGHFVPEEAGEAIVPRIAAFLAEPDREPLPA